MPVTSKDPRWKTAAGNEVEVCHVTIKPMPGRNPPMVIRVKMPHGEDIEDTPEEALPKIKNILHWMFEDTRLEMAKGNKNASAWKTAAPETLPTGEIKSKEVLHLNEDLNTLASKMKTLDLDLAKEWNKLDDEHRHTEAELFRPPMPLRQLSKAVHAVRSAHEAVETASRALNEAAQYFEG